MKNNREPYFNHSMTGFITSAAMDHEWSKQQEGIYHRGLVSVIVPCYNEEDNIRPFMEAINNLDLQNYDLEVIIVNDGSRDRSAPILETLKPVYPYLRVLHFNRNFGQQQALMAGIRNARGEVLATIVVLFFSSMQFILMGLMGEYIGKIFLQVRGRPGHIVTTCDFNNPDRSFPGPIRLSSHQKNSKIKNKFRNRKIHSTRSFHPSETWQPP